MYKSLVLNYKFIEIYSDGCLQINRINLMHLNFKKLKLNKKDYKTFQKLHKNKLLIKTSNNYINKIF